MTAISSPSSDRLHFTSGGYEVVYLAWPDMRAFRRFAIEPEEWESFEPEQFRVSGDPTLPPSPYVLMDFKRFMSRVPKTLVAEVSRFPEDHWALLSWLARAGVVGDELLRSNPCLALMLAKAASFSARPRRLPIWSLRPSAPQKKLLGKLGFPPTEAMRRLARKVVFSAMTVPRLRDIRDAIRRTPALVAHLSHLRRLNANVLAAAAAGGLQVTPRLLTQLSDASSDDPAATLGSALADTVRGLRLLHPRRPLPIFDHVSQVHRLHEQVIEELSLHKGRGTLPFPAPPVEGTNTIVPLRNAVELVVEGRDQHNCVASYERLARRGDVALYRVTAPERATLSLVRGQGSWMISELKGPCNRRVSERTREAVRRWLRGEKDTTRA
jgi:hypothetical protein